MPGLFSWFDRRDFLDRFENENPSPLSGSSLSRLGQASCVSTKDCGAGFACISGICERINSPANNATGDTAGDCNNGANGSSSCGTSGACSDGGNCGSGTTVSSCCGQDVSYVNKDANGNLLPSCLSITSKRTCRPFCTSYYASFGKTADGCEGLESCFADCEDCGLVEGDYACKKKLTSESTPCYCDNGARCGDCRACITNPQSSGYGNCAYIDGGNCGKCVTKESHICCGVDVGPVTVCPDENTSVEVALQEKLETLCAGACDQCEKSTYETYCSDKGNWDQRPDVDNLPSNTTQTGTLIIGEPGEEVTCLFFKITDRDNCSECLTEPVCNCHSDCPPGKTCTGVACV